MKQELFHLLLLSFALIFFGCAAGYMKIIKAGRTGEIDEVRSFVKAEPGILKEEDYQGRSVLMKAVEEGLLKTVKTLVEEGADVNYKSNKDGSTAFMYAAGSGRTEMARFLIGKGARINEKDNSGNSAAFWAAANGRNKTLIYLLNNKADAKKRNKAGLSLIQYASAFNNAKGVKLLMNKGFYDKKMEMSRLMIAIANGDKKTTERIIERNNTAEFSKQDFGGRTPLMWAVICGDRNAAVKLCSDKKSLQMTDIASQNAMHYAAMLGRLETAKVLMNMDINLKQRNKNGYTPLVLAMQNGDIEMIKYILSTPDGKKTVNIQDNRGLTPYNIAEFHLYDVPRNKSSRIKSYIYKMGGRPAPKKKK